MKKLPKSHLSLRSAPWMFLIIILGLPAPALCLDRNAKEVIEIISPATIKDKGNYGVLINRRPYGISESTIILDLMGKEIPLCDLPIPCEALVEYQMIAGQNPVCLRIEVRRLLEDSKDSG